MVKEATIVYGIYTALKLTVFVPIYFFWKIWKKMKVEEAEGEKVDKNGILVSSGAGYNVKNKRRHLWIGRSLQ